MLVSRIVPRSHAIDVVRAEMHLTMHAYLALQVECGLAYFRKIIPPPPPSIASSRCDSRRNIPGTPFWTRYFRRECRAGSSSPCFVRILTVTARVVLFFRIYRYLRKVACFRTRSPSHEQKTTHERTLEANGDHAT